MSRPIHEKIGGDHADYVDGSHNDVPGFAALLDPLAHAYHMSATIASRAHGLNDKIARIPNREASNNSSKQRYSDQ
jgi:hypothetical protein